MSKRFKPIELLSATVMLVVCCGASIYGILPFGTAMFCALSGAVFIGFVAPVYLLCAFLFTFELWRLYAAGAVMIIMAVRWFSGLKIPRCDRQIAKTLFSVSAIVVETVISGLFIPVADAVMTGFFACVFLYFAMRAAECVGNRFAYKLGVVEAASVCVVMFASGLAFGRAELYGVTAGLAPAMFVALMLGAVGKKAALACGAALALGLGINGEIALAPAFIACVLAIVAFDALPRPVYSIVSVGVFCAVAVLFYVDPVTVGWSALALSVGALLFCVIPRRAVRAVRAYFDFDGSARLAVRHYINRTKADAGNGMLAVASVFDETARLLNALGTPPPDHTAIGASIADGICPYCPRYAECDRGAATEAFTALAERAYIGKSIIAELPEFFTRECSRTVDIVSAATAVTENARELAAVRESENKAKSIVTERLAAVKDVLEELGKNQALPVGFDGVAEERIAAELNNNGVPCADVFCTRDGVTAIVRTDTASRERIARAVGVCLKAKCEIVSLEKTQAAGWSVATLKKRPAYEAVYARAGLAKDGISGDSYTFKRIGDRFLTALLDGMGTGVRAGESSGAAVELIECFYRAGFDSRSVLTGVNRFLKLPTAENYSAADVAVCDLATANVDIIKIGSPPCFIKTADTVLKIEGNSLPIGVLDEMRPSVVTKRLYPGQMLILVTDGVSDCFSGDELPEFINGLSAFNPEKAVNDILSRALALGGGTPKDDMTAIAFRLFDAPKKNKA